MFIFNEQQTKLELHYRYLSSNIIVTLMFIQLEFCCIIVYF